VLSSTIKKIPEKLKDKAEILSMSPKEVLHYISSQGFNNLYIDGGKVIQSFLQNDLIDEMIITKVPLLIGNGIPLFGPLKNDLVFKHIKTVVLSKGLVKSYYKRER
jgi:dihydrofolate reductase